MNRKLPSAPTITEILDYVDELDPKLAMTLSNGGLEDNCTTPLITHLTEADGTITHLKPAPNGGYLALYGRVSTREQKDYGRSITEQFTRLISWAISTGYQFRCFSDATLSGELPPNDPDLIRSAAQHKAKRYRKVFRRVFLKDYITRYSPAQKAILAAYCEKRCREILAGKADPETEEEVQTTERPPTTGRAKRRNDAAFRPALTVINHTAKKIWAVAFTDRSRLCRSQSLMIKLADLYDQAETKVIGVIEPLGASNSEDDDDDGAVLARMVLGYVAECKLTEVCTNSVRGLEQMLESGLPHGQTPFWVIRIKNDRNRTIRIDEDPKAIAAMREMVRLAIEGDPDAEEEKDRDLGAGRIALRLNAGIAAGDYHGPIPETETLRAAYPYGHFTREYIKHVMHSRLLLGIQSIFGIERQCLPVICDEYTLQKMRQRSEHRAGTKGGRPKATCTEFPIAQGLIQCWCGETLVHIAMRSQYACPATTRGKLTAKGRIHLVINAPHANAFFDKLGTIAPLELVETVTGVDESNTLHHLYTQATSELADLENTLADRRAASTAEWTTILKARHGEQHPAFARQLAANVDADLLEITTERDAQARTVAERLRAYDNYRPPVGYTDYRQQFEIWTAMSTTEKNDFYRRIFLPLRAEGDAPDQILAVLRRSGDTTPLPPIRLTCRNMGAGKWQRSLPDPAAWYASVRRYLRADNWIDEIHNFGLTATHETSETDTDPNTGEETTTTSVRVEAEE